MSGLREALATWRQEMNRSTGLARATVDRYVGDADRFVAWLEGQGGSAQASVATVAEVTAQDARDYRTHLLRAGRAPATINRALISLALFLDAAGRMDDNPFRKIGRIDSVEGAPRALAGLREEGYPVDADALAALSPYTTAHLNRFGRYNLDLTRVPPALDYDAPILSTEPRRKSSEAGPP